jgi:transcriptional regulator with XRE-family HTH domain
MTGIIKSKLPAILGHVANRLRELREERARRLYDLPSGVPVNPRQARLFTIAALAQRVGVGERTLRYWEAGVTLPTRRHQRALARELGVTVDELGLLNGRDALTRREISQGFKP